MTQSNDIRHRLLHSTSYDSLNTEQRIVNILRRHNVAADQSVYYTDLTTGKVREVDVLGAQVWKKHLKSGNLWARLSLVIEAKSSSDYHLLFSDSLQPEKINANYYWIGFDHQLQEATVSLLAQHQLDIEEIEHIMKRAKERAFPTLTQRTMRTFSLRVNPMTAPICASAFRETNVGGEKDLDNSVLWRALTTLRSAVESIKRESYNGTFQDLTGLFTPGQVYPVNLSQAIADIYDGAACRIQLFHPVVVTESKLWLASSTGLKELRWCRFVQLPARGSPDWWADVVGLEYFESYLEQLLAHYRKSFRTSRATIYTGG